MSQKFGTIFGFAEGNRRQKSIHKAATGQGGRVSSHQTKAGGGGHCQSFLAKAAPVVGQLVAKDEPRLPTFPTEQSSCTSSDNPLFGASAANRLRKKRNPIKLDPFGAADACREVSVVLVDHDMHPICEQKFE